MDLDGKAVLVTGAGNGIGRATAIAFANKGANLTVSDIDEDAVQKVRAEIEEAGGRAISIKTDVSSQAELIDAIEQTKTEFGSLDVMVNNAGVAVSGPTESMPLEDWRWVVDINMWPHVYAIQAVVPYFKERGSGHIVHVASAGGIFGTPGLAAYCMTKFAVFGLAESLAVGLQGTGVGVSVVCPLWVDTDIAARGRNTMDPDLGIDEETAKRLGRELLRNAGIPPEKVGEAIVLAVQEGRFLVLPHPEVLGLAQTKWADPEAYLARAAEAMQMQRQFFQQG